MMVLGLQDDPCQPKIGWQKRAANSVEERFLQQHCVAQFGVTASVPLPHLNVVLWRVSRSCVSPLTAPGASIRSRFVFCSCVASANPSLCLRNCLCGRPLDAFGHHRQLARTRGSWGAGGGLSSQQRQEYVVRQARACALTHSSATWTWVH